MKVSLSNPDKVFWPQEGITKKDLAQYYYVIKDFILPYLKDRPESLNRFPDGISGPHFYQKDKGNLKLPSWIKTCCIENTDYIVCQNLETLLCLVNLGCVEFNPWSSKISKTNYPDFMIFDLDPSDIAFSEVVKAALVIKKILDNIKIKSYPKTSGATGMHIYVPTGAKYTYDEVKSFAKLIVSRANRQLPDTTSIERSPQKRIGRVYLDFLQNNLGQTVAAPYSVRPVEHALVSTPLLWKEVNFNLSPQNFNIKNIGKRLDSLGDIFSGVLDQSGEDLIKGLELLRKL